MIKRLQKLKAKRGFTMIELIVVIAIIAVMSGVVLFGSNGRREKILEANTAAADFYSVIQAEFTGLQMFDGPITMWTNKQYTDDNLKNLKDQPEFGGLKYYPKAGGNYPFDGTIEPGETHWGGEPKAAALYIEVYAFAGTVRRVNYANDITELLELEKSNDNDKYELCMVLKEELKDRIEYKNGYYYARISYTPPMPDPAGLTVYDYRERPVKVDWAAYCANEITDPNETFLSQNYLTNSGICGVQYTRNSKATFESLGTTGTSFLSAGVWPTPTPAS